MSDAHRGASPSLVAGDFGAVDAEALATRLRTLREERGLTLREVAERLGISVSAVSQIERGVMRPSVNRLIALLTALDASVVEVFSDIATAQEESIDLVGHVVRRADDNPVVTLGGGVTYRRLDPGSTRDVDFFESTYPPGSQAAESSESSEFLTHVGYEIGTVVRGELTIEFPTEQVVLSPGDSISYSCSTPHRLSNHGTVETVATWLVVHPGGTSASGSPQGPQLPR